MGAATEMVSSCSHGVAGQGVEGVAASANALRGEDRGLQALLAIRVYPPRLSLQREPSLPQKHTAQQACQAG